MLDIHCHILPGFDDGAADVSESVQMARMAVESGVTGIVVTPHFRGEPDSLRALNRLVNRYERLIQEVSRENIPLRLFPGAEILCLPETPDMASRRELPTLGNTDYLLVEFFFNESVTYMNNMLRDLSRYGYHPVIAHPERYEGVQEDPAVLEYWFGQGYVLQLNKGSILGAFGSRVERTARWALERGFAHVVASDGHSARRRTPELRSLRQRLQELCPEEYVWVLLDGNPERIVRGMPMEPHESV